MFRVNLALDPSKTGGEASVLERNLRKLIVVQDEAVYDIVNVYQMYLTAINVPGRPIGNFLFLALSVQAKSEQEKQRQKYY